MGVTLRLKKAVQRADYLASFIGLKNSRALFVGLYKIGDHKVYSIEQLQAEPAYRELSAFGMQETNETEREDLLWFELERQDFYSDWSGRLVINWPPPGRVWYRWAHRNIFEISTIHETNILNTEIPPWDQIVLTQQELQALPSSWRKILSQWRGIYLIFDESDGQAYVGSAYGAENIIGRWLNYAKNGHGGNKELRQRDSSRFRFSILQRVSPDMDPADVIRLEGTWKDRLHTREFGMNCN